MNSLPARGCSADSIFNSRSLIVAAGLAVTLATSHLHAQTLNWANTLGGAASLSGNWSPAAVPNSANALIWNLNNTYGVTFNNLTTASLSHTYKRGTVSLGVSTPHTTGNFLVADLAAEVATARLTSGTLTSTGIITVGNAATSAGTLNIIGSTTTLTQAGTGDTNIGTGGNGNLSILTGGKLTVADQFLAGSNNTSISTVTVSGTVAGQRRSTLEVLGTGDSRIGSGGDVTMIIDSGAFALFAGNLTVANGSASTSSLTVGNTNANASQLLVNGDLSLGRNTSPGAAGGTGSLIVLAGGAVDVDGTINIGNDPDGGTGLLRLEGPNPSLITHALALGAGGTLDFRSGALTIRGGAFTVPNGFALNLSQTTNPETLVQLVLENGATHTATNTTTLSNIANSNVGLAIQSGASFHQNTGVMQIGVVDTARCSLTLNNGALTTSNSLRIGVAGDGNFTLSNLSTATVRDLDVATNAIGTGIVTINNSTLTITEDLVVGGSSNGAGGFNNGGSAQFNLNAGAILNTPVGRTAFFATDSTLNINGGSLNANGSLFCTGTLTLNTGTINAPFIEAYDTCTGTGTINARLFTANPFTLTGPLTVGNSATNSIDNLKTIIGPHTLTCIDPDIAVLANTTIAGGTINAANGLRLASGATLSGFGIINTSFENLGTVTATTAAGITFAGQVTSTAGTLGGTRIHFVPGSSYTGRNITGLAKWHSDANTTLNFTAGTSSIGDNTADAVIVGGNLDVTGTLILNDNDGVALGPTSTIRGGSVGTLSAPIFTLGRTGNTRHILRGTGTISANFNSSGTISPGLDEGDRTGTLSIAGFYSQAISGQTGELIMDLDGTSTLLHDTLALNGGGAVDGILQLRIGYTPLNGQRIPIITRGATGILVGTFDTLIAPPGWSLDYQTNSIDAVYCAPDFNADGVADFFDYLDFVDAFSAADPRADINADAVIDFFDYLDFVDAFSAGC